MIAYLDSSVVLRVALGQLGALSPGLVKGRAGDSSVAVEEPL